MVRRGFQIFGLAFLFRVQAWILGWSSSRNLLKLDILNIMGPSVAAAAALWGAARTLRARLFAFLLGTVVIAFATHLIRAAPLDALPDPIEAIKIRMHDLEMTRKDLQPLIGSRGRVSEVLNRKRLLTLSMIRKLHEVLHIPLEVLAQPYEMQQPTQKDRVEVEAALPTC